MVDMRIFISFINKLAVMLKEDCRNKTRIMKTKFSLQKVIDELIDAQKSLTGPLMKLNYFARLIKNAELIEYTTNEFNGYQGPAEVVPEYRKTLATLFLDTQAHFNRHTVQLPISMLEEPYRNSLQYVCLREGISTIEKLARESESNDTDNEIITVLPMEMLRFFQEPTRKLYKSDVRIDVIGARLSGNANAVISIPTSIRTKLLEFAMNIAENFGYDIEIESFNDKREINNQTIINQMNTTINNSGDGNIITTGNENQIENNVTLHKGNFERLQSELEKQGIDEADIAELSTIVAQEEPMLESNRLGENANGWISKILNKSLNGIGKIATRVSANLLATLVKQYYGMS